MHYEYYFENNILKARKPNKIELEIREKQIESQKKYNEIEKRINLLFSTNEKYKKLVVSLAVLEKRLDKAAVSLKESKDYLLKLRGAFNKSKKDGTYEKTSQKERVESHDHFMETKEIVANKKKIHADLIEKLEKKKEEHNKVKERFEKLKSNFERLKKTEDFKLYLKMKKERMEELKKKEELANKLREQTRPVREMLIREKEIGKYKKELHNKYRKELEDSEIFKKIECINVSGDIYYKYLYKGEIVSEIQYNAYLDLEIENKILGEKLEEKKEEIVTSKESEPTKKVVGSYWKYTNNDLIVSKFVNFLTKDGKKNRGLKILFKVLLNIKRKFGINPILFIKYIILKRNSFIRTYSKQVKGKTFYTFRVLNYKKQINLSIKKIINIVNHFKKKYNLKYWQSLFLVTLNTGLIKKKRKLYKNSKYKNINKFNKLNDCKKMLYHLLLKKILLNIIKKNGLFYLLRLEKKYNKEIEILGIQESVTTQLNHVLGIIIKNKNISLFKIIKKYLFFIKLIKKYNKIRLKINKRRIKRRARKLRLLNRLRNSEEKNILKIIKNQNKKSYFGHVLLKNINELQRMKQYKYSVLNFKKKYKLKKEQDESKRIHLFFNEKLCNRVIFFKKSKRGQERVSYK